MGGFSGRRLRRALLATGCVMVAAGCGSSGSSSTTGGGSASTTAPTLTAAPTTATTSASATSTSPSTGTVSTGSGSSSGPAGPAIFLLHSVTTAAGVDLRIVTPGGGAPARSVTVLPANSYIWDAAHGEVLVDESGSGTLVVVDLGSGASNPIAHDMTGVSGAISPDGSKVAYLAQTSSGGFALRLTTVAGGSSQTLRTFSSGPVPDPLKWGPDGIVADLIVPNSDAPSQGVDRLDPATGAELARSSGVGQNGLAACGDGDHVAASDHTSGLGDEGDVPPGPGPQGPPNTLRLVTIGGAQTVIRKAAHHQIEPLACPGDGSMVLVIDNPSAGGFAGISQSPDFGLLLVSSTGATTQLDHYGTTYDAGVVLQDGATVAAARRDGSTSTLVQLASGHAPVTLDSVAGAQAARVDLVSGG